MSFPLKICITMYNLSIHFFLYKKRLKFGLILDDKTDFLFYQNILLSTLTIMVKNILSLLLSFTLLNTFENIILYNYS